MYNGKIQLLMQHDQSRWTKVLKYIDAIVSDFLLGYHNVADDIIWYL